MRHSCSLSLPVLVIVGRRAVAPLPRQRRITRGMTPPPPGRGGTRCLHPLPPSGCNPMMEAARIPPPCQKTRRDVQSESAHGNVHAAGKAGQCNELCPPLVRLHWGSCGGSCGCGCSAEDQQGGGRRRCLQPTNPNMTKLVAWPLGGDSNRRHCRPRQQYPHR